MVSQLVLGASALLFVAVLLAAAVSDIRCRLIPNRYPLLLALAFGPAALAAGPGWAVAGLHLGVGLGLLILGAALFFGGLWGAGDAKLLAAVGLWTGLPGLSALLVMTALVGGVMALGVLLARRLQSVKTLRPNSVLARIGSKTGPLPYGVAIAAAGVLLLVRGGTVLGPLSGWLPG